MITVSDVFGAIKHCESYGANHPLNSVLMASSSILHYTTYPTPKDAYALIFRLFIDYMNRNSMICTSHIYGIVGVTGKPICCRVFSYSVKALEHRSALLILEEINYRVRNPWITTLITLLRHHQ